MGKYYNNQKYCDCQFITLINACVFWNKPHIKPYSKMYNRLAHKAHCINGSCINLNEAYKLLNIKFIKGKLNLNWIKRNLPIEFSIFCHRGYHSVLCVKVENNKLQLTNYYRNRLYSISWDKLKKLQNKHVKPKQIKIK